MISLDLSGRTALVTGSAIGIGRAIAQRLAEAGAAVIITDVDAATGVKTAAEIGGAHGGPARFFPLDVTDVAAAGQLAERLPEVDILINNAGICPRADFVSLDSNTWAKTIEINLTGTFNISRAFVPGMVKRNYGRVIHIGSASSITGTGGGAHYAASKYGMQGLTRAMARELGRNGITVNCVAPRVIVTDLLMHLYDAERMNGLAAGIPVGRAGQPEDIANAVVFLASDYASYVTGQVILLDGGRTFA
jgi:3-oxoacyl-[acyl-carrier protein] reductase